MTNKELLEFISKANKTKRYAKWLTVLAVVCVILFSVSFAYYFKVRDVRSEYKEQTLAKDSLQSKYDSVRDVLFSTEVELTRYQITLENMDSVTKEKFERFLYTQTE